MNTKWEKRFITLAYHIAQWSADTNKQVGAILVSPDYRQFSMGYNGPPRGTEILDLKVNGIVKDWERESKNSVTVHAELNAILNSAVDIKGWTMFITEPPCLHCACALVQKQLEAAYFPKLRPESKWFDEQQRAVKLLMMHMRVVTFNQEQ
jgi:dCMP deaminase